MEIQNYHSSPFTKLVLGLALLLCCSFQPVFAFDFDFDFDHLNVRELRNLANLHPLDTFTADVLEDDEWHYGQPPIPAPGYNFVGLSDDWTLQLDYTAWLGGVPSVNLRRRLSEGENLSTAAEFMVIYMDEDLDEMDEDQDHLFIKREGLNGYARINASYRLNRDIRLHASLGYSYSESLVISNEDRDEFIGDEWEDLVDPAATIGYEHFINDNLMFVANISYGETWMLFENRPRKEQIVYGFRWVPFADSPRPLLRNLAVDMIALYANFPDAEEDFGLPIPIFPVFTWQW